MTDVNLVHMKPLSERCRCDDMVAGLLYFGWRNPRKTSPFHPLILGVQCSWLYVCVVHSHPQKRKYVRTPKCFFSLNGGHFFSTAVCFLGGSMLSCFSAFLLFYFSASLLFCFSAFLLFAFPASLLFMLLCCSALPASFLSASLLSLLFCFSAFPAFLLLCFVAFVLLCLSTSTIFSSVMCFCCSTSCSSASLLPVFTASLFFLFFCFILSCLLTETLKTLGEPKETAKNPDKNSW